MPDSELGNLSTRMLTTERNVADQAKTLTALIDEIKAMQEPLEQLRIDREVRKERDKHVHERFDRLQRDMADGFARIEKDITSRFATLNKPLWAAATAFIGTLVAAITTWVTSGGMTP